MKQRGGSQNEGWTEEDVRKVLTNPIYVGIGPYPAAVTDDDWIAAITRLIKLRGAAPVMKLVLHNLREAFPAK